MVELQDGQLPEEPENPDRGGWFKGVGRFIQDRWDSFTSISRRMKLTREFARDNIVQIPIDLVPEVEIGKYSQKAFYLSTPRDLRESDDKTRSADFDFFLSFSREPDLEDDHVQVRLDLHAGYFPRNGCLRIAHRMSDGTLQMQNPLHLDLKGLLPDANRLRILCPGGSFYIIPGSVGSFEIPQMLESPNIIHIEYLEDGQQISVKRGRIENDHDKELLVTGLDSPDQIFTYDIGRLKDVL